ncbi:MAG: hypothetical protein EHM61_08820 [Acidobacteria bacterium]|nr:MAG: hypothetical protein EHM61_08820 [Acidobacteriota bacterium]RPJ58949.1 MAG: hypothetical protein EHM23_15795 [Acidobacteriota bacterium]
MNERSIAHVQRCQALNQSSPFLLICARLLLQAIAFALLPATVVNAQLESQPDGCLNPSVLLSAPQQVTPTIQGRATRTMENVKLSDPNAPPTPPTAGYRNLVPMYQPTFDLSSPTWIYTGRPNTIAPGGLMISFYSPGQFVVTDPTGRRTGYDVASGERLSEIPNSSYDENATPGLVPGEESSREFQVMGPAEGEYKVDITGTGDGTYSLEFYRWEGNDESRLTVDDVPIYTGERQSWVLQVSASVTEPQTAGGGYDGGGQRPRDVNKLLSYVRPTDNRVDLPAGSTGYDLVINCGLMVSPNTFSATLNGMDISALFKPTAAGREVVHLALGRGTNVLLLSIEGQVGSRMARDSDRLVFRVP